MPVLAHPQKHQIQDWQAIFAWQRNPAQFRLGSFYSSGRWIFAVNAMNLVRGDFQRSEQEFVGQFEVAFRVIRWNTTLIGPEKMHVVWEGRRVAVPSSSGLSQLDNCGIEFLRNAPPR